MKKTIFIALALFASIFANATDYTVNSLTDAGTGTGTTGDLRYCITQMNASGTATNNINFSVAGTINLSSPLPVLNRQVAINGYSAPGAVAGTMSGRTITVQLILPGAVSSAFTVQASNTVISGFNFVTFNTVSGAAAAVNHYSTTTDATSNVWVWGNYFGTNMAGTATYANQAGFGFSVYGNTSGAGALSTLNSWVIGTNGDGSGDANEGNLFSQPDPALGTTANAESMRFYNCDNFVIAGNTFGLQKDGVTPLQSFAAVTTQGYGVALNNCMGFRIGTNGDGVSDALERNVLTGVRTAAIVIFGNKAGGQYYTGDATYTLRPQGNNGIYGNYFGTDITGMGTSTDLQNRTGIQIRGSRYNTIGSATNVAMRNVIVNNGRAASLNGIYITGEPVGTAGDFVSEYNTIAGNYIGVLADGVTPLGNGTGVRLNGNSNLTTGSVSTYKNFFDRNIIANNIARGIDLRPNATNPALVYDNTFTQNAIYGNTGLGINIGSTSTDISVTPNDGLLATPSTTNANRGVDYGVITSANLTGNSLDVRGYIGNSTAGNAAFKFAQIELFLANNSPADQNGAVVSGDGLSVAHGEGKTYLGTLTANASGLFSGTLDVTGKGFVAGTSQITNTVTEYSATGSTSEFGATLTAAACAAADDAAPALTATTLSNTCPASSVNLASITATNQNGDVALSWHTGTPATDANRLASTVVTQGGIYFAAFRDATTTNCYSITTAVTVTVSRCTVIKNTCPATTIDLTAYAAAVAGKTITWHTGTPATDANKVANPAAVGTGTYYAAFYDATGGCYSPTSGQVLVSINTCNTIAGKVYDDLNGLSDNTINGIGTNASGLNAILYDSTTLQVVGVVAVAADGSYSFGSFPGGNKYTLFVTTSSASLGQTAVPGVSLPSGWVSTGENNGSGAGNDGAVNSVLPLGIVTASVSNANFGLDRIPTANDVNGTYINPGGTATVVVPTLNGNDPEQGALPGIGNLDTVIIKTLPASGTLYYNGVAVAAGQQINNYNPANLTYDPPAGDGSYSFTYSEVDAAGLASAPATVTMSFSTLLVSGTVYHDADGGSINGIPTNTVGSNTLYVNLVSGSNQVVASVPVNGDGTYSFGTADGLAANTSYLLVLSNTQGTVGSAPPSNILTNAINTAEGTPPAGDGTPNGYVGITVGTASLTNTNFAVEELPTAGSGANTVANPGGTTQVTVPLSTFTNITPTTDPDGTVPNIRITGFPTGAASVVINGTTYTAAGGGGTTAWPAAGVITPVTSLGSVDPAFNGTGDVVFSFKAIDNLGKEGQNTGTATLRFLIPDLTPVIRLPSNGFAAAGSQADFVAELVSLIDITTTAGSTRFSITAPVGYTISFSPSLTTITAAGAGAATAVQNPSWQLVSTQLGGRRLNFQAKAGISIAALQKAELGFTLTRTTSFQGSVPVVTINIADDAGWQYDSVPPNNIFTRIVNSL